LYLKATGVRQRFDAVTNIKNVKLGSR